jgi:hypothetical protein
MTTISAQVHSTKYSIGVKGSFVIAVICKDGIIMASDSRANIFDKSDLYHKPIAYYDLIQKIFPIGSNAIAETGQGLILNVFFSTIVEIFSKNRVPIRVDKLLPSFIDYCGNNFPPEVLSEMKKQKLFAAGYVNNIPTICYYNEEQPEQSFGCIQNMGYIQSDKTLLSEYDSGVLVNMSSNEVADLAIKAIKEYSKENERWKTIGGPIQVLLISHNKTSWIKNEPPLQRWTYISDFIEDFINNKVNITPISPTTIEQLKNLFLSVPKK